MNLCSLACIGYNFKSENTKGYLIVFWDFPAWATCGACGFLVFVNLVSQEDMWATIPWPIDQAGVGCLQGVEIKGP
jgi:hypothetical protein